MASPTPSLRLFVVRRPSDGHRRPRPPWRPAHGSDRDACAARPPCARWSASTGSIRRCSSRRSSSGRAAASASRSARCPGSSRLSPDEAVREAERLAGPRGRRRPAVRPAGRRRTPTGTGRLGRRRHRPGGVRGASARASCRSSLIADTCLCEYTDHGHCGPLRADGTRRQRRGARPRSPRTAVSQARAGADIVAPERDDGRPGRARSAPPSTPPGSPRPRSWPTRRSTPRPSTGRSARRPTAPRRSATGAATRWTRPTAARRSARWRSTSPRAPTSCWSSRRCRGSTSIAAARARFDLPIAAYQVCGEYAMLAAAAERGWIDGRRAMTEAVTAIVRAGAGDRHHLRRGRPRRRGSRGARAPMSRRHDLRPGARPRARPGLAAAAPRRRAARRRLRLRRRSRPRRPATASGRSATRSSGSSRASTSCSGAWRRSVEALETSAAALAALGPRPLADGPRTRCSAGSGRRSTSASRPTRSSRFQRRALALPGRLPVHQDHRLVPARARRRGRA